MALGLVVISMTLVSANTQAEKDHQFSQIAVDCKFEHPNGKYINIPFVVESFNPPRDLTRKCADRLTKLISEYNRKTTNKLC